jgi:hypothetical protein
MKKKDRHKLIRPIKASSHTAEPTKSSKQVGIGGYQHTPHYPGSIKHVQQINKQAVHQARREQLPCS